MWRPSPYYTVVIIVCTLASKPGEVMGCKHNHTSLGSICLTAENTAKVSHHTCSYPIEGSSDSA